MSDATGDRRVVDDVADGGGGRRRGGRGNRGRRGRHERQFMLRVFIDGVRVCAPGVEYMHTEQPALFSGRLSSLACAFVRTHACALCVKVAEWRRRIAASDYIIDAVLLDSLMLAPSTEPTLWSVSWGARVRVRVCACVSSVRCDKIRHNEVAIDCGQWRERMGVGWHGMAATDAARPKRNHT